jgi:hypothetical protein
MLFEKHKIFKKRCKCRNSSKKRKFVEKKLKGLADGKPFLNVEKKIPLNKN